VRGPLRSVPVFHGFAGLCECLWIVWILWTTRQGSRRRLLPTRAGLFSGLVEGGKAVGFEAPRMRVRFRHARNLVITVNGVRRSLTGTMDAIVSVHGLTKA
jgi:hypothetical protein